MIAWMVAISHRSAPHIRHGLSGRRRHDVGMLATYPEVFAGGAVIAGCRSVLRPMCGKR